MATNGMDETFTSEELMTDVIPSSLPDFPVQKAIDLAFPELAHQPGRLGKIHFAMWVDYTLEFPDEIWEKPVDEETTCYHYIYYISNEGAPPAFVVEISCIDDVWRVNNYTLIVTLNQMAQVKTSMRVYSREKDWERESFIKHLNDEALQRYDEDRLEEARTLIDSAINLKGSDSAYLLNNRGLICWKMGNTEQAKRDFLESIKLDDNNGDPYFNIGLIFLDESNLTEALHYLQRAVEINPCDGQFLTELGHLYLELDMEAKALTLFKQAFATNSSDAQINFHLGYYFLYKKRNAKSALKYFRKGLKKEPDDQFALADLAVAHWVTGNRKKTVQIHDVLRRSSMLMPYTISRLVYLNMVMENYDVALHYYKEALSNEDPFEPEWLHYNAALVYAKTGRREQALDILNLAVTMGGEAVIKRALAEKALDIVKGLSDFKKLVKTQTKRKS